MNTLYYGDNLDILRENVASESVDLIYLDPPFNSNRAYNVLFKSRAGRESAAQIEAFDDTWNWSHESEAIFVDLTQRGGAPTAVAETLRAMHGSLGTNDLFAYLVMMAARLVELHRVLKQTGSLYLHCDPTASHYLKITLDALFGPRNFRSEIVWQRTSAHSDGKQGRRNYGHIHDVLLFYTKSDVFSWNPVFTPYDQEYVDAFYRHIEPGTGRRYRKDNLTAAKPGGDTSYEWKGVPPYKGRYWAYSRAKMERFDREGRLVYTAGGMPNYKRYLDEMPGVPLQDVWTDIKPIGPKAKERLGYPTQKPVALLERIISASSNRGDVVLDAFCGCGTTIEAAQKLERQWIGIDITILAVDLIKRRLMDAYGDAVVHTFAIKGTPTELESAKRMWNDNKFEFERWAVTLVEGEPNLKQVGDKGVDGVIRFILDQKYNTGRALVSVKGGHQINPGMVRDLTGTVSSQNAEMGVMITLDDPTPGMVAAARSSGVYVWPFSGQSFPRAQILTVEDLLVSRRRPNMPTPLPPYLPAPRRGVGDHSQLRLT